ncbi:hypothetical protein D3C85_1030810 [compost metagenome]
MHKPERPTSQEHLPITLRIGNENGPVDELSRHSAFQDPVSYLGALKRNTARVPLVLAQEQCDVFRRDVVRDCPTVRILRWRVLTQQTRRQLKVPLQCITVVQREQDGLGIFSRP